MTVEKKVRKQVPCDCGVTVDVLEGQHAAEALDLHRAGKDHAVVARGRQDFVRGARSSTKTVEG